MYPCKRPPAQTRTPTHTIQPLTPQPTAQTTPSGSEATATSPPPEPMELGRPLEARHPLPPGPASSSGKRATPPTSPRTSPARRCSRSSSSTPASTVSRSPSLSCVGGRPRPRSSPGGYYTTTVEGYIPSNGRGIRGATSHCLGQNFSRMFDITVEDPNEKGKHPRLAELAGPLDPRHRRHGDDPRRR